MSECVCECVCVSECVCVCVCACESVQCYDVNYSSDSKRIEPQQKIHTAVVSTYFHGSKGEGLGTCILLMHDLYSSLVSSPTHHSLHVHVPLYRSGNFVVNKFSSVHSDANTIFFSNIKITLDNEATLPVCRSDENKQREKISRSTVYLDWEQGYDLDR